MRCSRRIDAALMRSTKPSESIIRKAYQLLRPLVKSVALYTVFSQPQKQVGDFTLISE